MHSNSSIFDSDNIIFPSNTIAESISEIGNATNLLQDTVWPPPYSLRLSTRAKRITVQISLRRGLEILLPKRKRPPSAASIEAVLRDNKTWITRHLSAWHQEQKRKSHEPLLPEKLCFPAFEKEIAIIYQNTASLQVRVKTLSLPNPSYLLSGSLQDISKVIPRLKKILFQEAHLYLISWLNRLSLSTGLFYSEAIIRSQTSLWGSCTTAKKISLNAKLLFLPKELIEYVLLHELCHTRYMNHSEKFWNLLKQFDPHCLAHRRALRKASIYLPRWIEQDLVPHTR